MSNKVKEWSGVVALVAIILVLGIMPKGSGNSNVGGVGTRFPNGVGVGSGTMVLQTGFFQASSTAQFSGAVQLFSTTKIGLNGTNLTQVNAGLGYIYPYAALIPASTTKLADIQASSTAGMIGGITALAGVSANDNCIATLSTTTAGTTYGGLSIKGVGASTTAGYITVAIHNGTGIDYTWPTTGTATGTAYYICTRP